MVWLHSKLRQEDRGGGKEGMRREERVCKECESGEVEDVEHWLLRCVAWKTLREPLLWRAQEHQFQMMAADILRDLWLVLFGACWKNGMIPSEWRRSVVVPVPKKQCGGVCTAIDLEELH